MSDKAMWNKACDVIDRFQSRRFLPHEDRHAVLIGIVADEMQMLVAETKAAMLSGKMNWQEGFQAGHEQGFKEGYEQAQKDHEK